MPTNQPRLAIVVPCYNEQACLPHSLQSLSEYLGQLITAGTIAADSYLYFVDDGSTDETWEIIMQAHQHNKLIKGIKLTRNMGHQNALLAGLLNVKHKADCVVSMDADLQDDLQAIPEMLQHYQQGFDVVCGVRRARVKDRWFKRFSAHVFYKLMQRSGAEIIHNHADFRLVNNRVIAALERFEERHLFLRGIFPLLGFRTAQVFYDRRERAHGQPQYTFRKMLALAWDGLTSFGHLPLKLILITGLLSFILALLLIVWVIIAKVSDKVIPGWASIMIPLCFMGGVQLLSIGVIGEYIAKVYMEVKRRPRFIEEMELQ